MKNLIKFGAIVAGATAGAVISALITTEKGKKVRNRISHQLKSGAESFKDSRNTFKDFVSALASSNKGDFEGTLTSMIDKAADKTEQVISVLEKKLSEMKAEKQSNIVEKIDPKEDPVYKAAYETKIDL